MKITPLQQYLILGVLAFAGISYLYYQFLLKPLNNRIQMLRVDLAQQTEELEKVKKTAEKYEEFKKRADTIQRELEWVQNRIPKTIDHTQMVEILALIRNRADVGFTKFDFRDNITPKDAPYIEVPVNLTFTGNFQGLLNFLYQIEISNLLMTVREVTVKEIGNSFNEDLTIEAQMLVCGVQVK